MTWDEVVALATVVVITLGLILDIAVRVIAYTRERQKDFFNLHQRVRFIEEELKQIQLSRGQLIKEFRDIQGILKKKNLYERNSDELNL